ncbi:receptor-type tyrosine-protein phosphatase V isoform X2 [Microcaecilia unicolor]|uniref:protein-tyrosine-phosphatase n=1 Tax=Microcaecilia unicolor TaxID=1415580 RepID=A0A6P7ZTF3_9AMPH|nr:receptor-type tyrosine-protein phosphatase V-like isoform X2 [Microcaecilia unicolor]
MKKLLLVCFLRALLLWIPGVRLVQANECYNNATSQEADEGGETAQWLNLTISNLDSTDSLLITWKRPVLDVLGYYVILSELNSDTVLKNKSVSLSTTSFQFDALAPGTGYSAEVTARFECSRTVSQTVTEWTRPSPLSEVHLQNPSSISTSAVIAAWVDSSGAEWYHLTLYNMLSGAFNQAVSAGRGTSNHTFQNLSSGTPFCLRINASAGPYQIVGPNATAWTAPLSPTNVSLRNTGEAKSLLVHWQKSSGWREKYQVTLHKVDSGMLAKNLSAGMDMTHLELLDLVPGTQYVVQVTAIAGPYRALSQEAKAWTSPVVPSRVSLTNHGSASVLHAHWDEASGGNYITTLYTVDPFRIIENGSLVRGFTNLTYEELAPGTHYGFQIQTVAGPFISSPQNVTAWTYPLPPAALSLQNKQSSTSLWASWSQPTAGPMPHYAASLFEATSTIPLKNMTVSQGSTNVTFEGLIPGRQYTIQMSAVAGPYRSFEQTASNWTYPLAPSKVMLTNEGKTSSLYASWDRAPGDRDEYFLQLFSMGHQMEKNISLGGSQQNCTIDGLQPGQRYILQVTAVAGPYWSSSKTVTEWTNPLPMDNVTVTNVQTSPMLHVHWIDSGDGGTDRWVRLYSKQSHTLLQNVSVERGATSVTLDDLDPGMQYSVEVVSQAGPHEAASQKVVGYTYPLSPLALNVTSEGNSSVLVAQWKTPAGDREGYLISLYNNGESTALRQLTVNSDSTNSTLVGLIAGSWYRVEVQAVSGQHYRSVSQNATACTSPIAPADVKLSSRGSSTALYATWMEPAGGRDSYRLILHSARSQGKLRDVSVGHSDTSYVFHDLPVGSPMTLSIAAICGPSESFSPNITEWTYPLAPEDLTLSNLGSQSALHIFWKAYTEGQDECSVTLYEVPSGGVADHVSLGRDVKNYTFNNLVPGKKYGVEVSATAGPYKATSRNITDWTYPLAPSSLIVTNDGRPDSLRASWEEAAGERTGYTIVMYDAVLESVVRNVSVGQDARNFTFSGLTPGKKYNVEIISVAGPYTASSGNVTDWTYPLASTNMNITNEGSSDSLHVFWEEVTGQRDSYEVILYNARTHSIARNVSIGRDTHNFTFSELTPGRKYEAHLISVAGLYRMPAGNATDWTYPLAPTRVTVTNGGHSDILRVFWARAAGDQDSYSLSLYDTRQHTVAARKSLGEDIRNFTFTGLTPGNKYSVEIVTVAGPYGGPAVSITEWTYPLAPVRVSVTNDGQSDSLRASWEEAAGVRSGYQVVLYDTGQGNMIDNISVGQDTRNITVSGLTPGTKYSVEVVSVTGPYGVSAENVTDWTYPLAPENVSVVIEEDNTILVLSWSRATGLQDSYQVWLLDLHNQTASQSSTVAKEVGHHLFQGLVPGRNYSVSVTSVVGPYQNSSESVLVAAEPMPLSDAQCWTQETILHLNWSLLQEQSDLCILTAEKESGGSFQQAVHLVTIESEVSLRNLEPYSLYRINLTAVGINKMKSQTVTLLCNASPKALPDSRNTLPVPVLAGIIAGSFLIVAAVLGLVFWKRGREKRREKSNLSQEMTAYSLRNIHRPIPVQTFKQVFEMKSANACHGFFQEFEELKEVGKDQSKAAAELSANSCKNRYPHVLPYDHSRVKLSRLGDDPSSDYINGNFIPGYAHPQEYIVTQGPLKKTIEDFWRMVWEQNVYNIVMLTVCMENGRVLCDHYWPSDSSPITYGQITVHLIDQNISNEWTTRGLKLWHEDVKLERKVHQLHYTEWPDHGVPESTSSIITFTEMVREHVQAAKGSGPTLVNCSAGVGRSGTFIGLDRLLQQVKLEKVADVFSTVYTMRVNRYQMIQTLGQYIFLHSCILEKITEERHASKEISRPILQTSFFQHCLKNSTNSCAGFQREYEVLLEAAKDEAGGGTADPVSIIQQTNTYSSILPYDRSRIKFSPLDLEPSSELTSAWFIPGYCSAKDYLAVKGPDRASADHFWRLVLEHNVHTIITLVPPCNEKGQLWCEECWPSDSSPVCASGLAIHLSAMKDVQGWKCSQLKMKRKGERETTLALLLPTLERSGATRICIDHTVSFCTEKMQREQEEAGILTDAL